MAREFAIPSIFSSPNEILDGSILCVLECGVGVMFNAAGKVKLSSTKKASSLVAPFCSWASCCFGYSNKYSHLGPIEVEK